MCGIAGILKLNAPTTPEDVAAVRRMIDAQIHRGPDGEGIIALGDRREALGENAVSPLPLTPRGA